MAKIDGSDDTGKIPVSHWFGGDEAACLWLELKVSTWLKRKGQVVTKNGSFTLILSSNLAFLEKAIYISAGR